MTAQTISCLRAPSDGLRKLLMPGGFLEPLMALNGRKFNGAELDVHFRINDEVQVYCGLTVILAVKSSKARLGPENLRPRQVYGAATGKEYRTLSAMGR